MNLQNPKAKIGEPKKLTVKEFMEEPKGSPPTNEQMMEVFRFTHTYDEMNQSPVGKWVQYKWYKKVIAEKESQLTDLKSQNLLLKESAEIFSSANDAYHKIVYELKETIQHALDIKDLWLRKQEDVEEEHIGEATALSIMESTFIELLK